jgi:hypothetical protein
VRDAGRPDLVAIGAVHGMPSRRCDFLLDVVVVLGLAFGVRFEVLDR